MAHSDDNGLILPPALAPLHVVIVPIFKTSEELQQIKDYIQPLIDTQNFSSVAFFPYDSEKIITTYKELKKKVSRSFTMEKKVTFPPIDGVKQAFLGLVKCKDFVTILTDSRIAIIIC